MRILWISPNYLHPTTKGGQIRTLGLMRCLSKRHEIDYVTFADPGNTEGPARAGEYCARVHAIPHTVVDKRSWRFWPQLIRGLVSPLPVTVDRFRSPKLRAYVEQLLAREAFDRIVVDFLVMAASSPALDRSVLFQHNVETMIWRRHAEHAQDALRRSYFRMQARKMFRFEARCCREAAQVVAVSEIDAELMRSMFAAERISVVPTGVDLEYFARPANAAPVADLVFAGSMDWRPNVDGVLWFCREVLPLIRERRPGCTFAIAGRMPPPEILALARNDSRITVTGTVADIRPYMWGARVSVVPLRIGGGTRLKIYESMAAETAVVSTSVGAEGLEVHPGRDILIADSPEAFAAHCTTLLEDAPARAALTTAGCALVRERSSWEQMALRFERMLESVPAACPKPRVGAASMA